MPALTPASNRIHVLEVIGNAIVGGMETSVARLIERLPPERFAVSAMCPFESPYTDRLRNLGAEVYITPMPEDPSWHSIQLVCAMAKANAVDVIHSHLPNAHLLAGLAGRLVGKPVVATIHGRQLTALDLEVHRAAGTHLQVVCKQSYFHALGIGISPAQLHCIANGVDTEVFTPRRLVNGPLRQRFSVPEKAHLIGFVGRLSPEKGPDVFLRTALGVHEASPKTRFLLVGDGPMLRQLKAFVAQFDLGSCVHFAGMQDDMPAVMSELDALVSTSHSEAMPLALMEAMASGLPVIATRVGGIPDLVQHGVTGWLAHDADYEGLASRVLDLVKDDALRRLTGENARRRAVERLSLRDAVAGTMQLLTRLAQPRAEQRRIGPVTSDGKLVNGVLASTSKSAVA
jgi:glycosyltransferase involved in cell wall biosynthesis